MASAGGSRIDVSASLTATSRSAPDSHWPEDLARRVVVVSTGHTEQHGLHLPIGTDTLIAEAIAEGLVRRCPE